MGHPDYRPLHDGHKLSIAKFLGPRFTTEWLKPCDQAAREIGPLDHDQFADAVTEYLHEKNAAHHPESECGRELGPGEIARLSDKVVHLPIKGIAA